MAQFSVNAQRFDPYKNFKFRVKWDGRYVAGICKVGAFKRTTEVVKHREAADRDRLQRVVQELLEREAAGEANVTLSEQRMREVLEEARQARPDRTSKRRPRK